MAEKKKCSKCGELKPLDQFHREASSKDGRASRCAECRREDARRYWQRRREVEAAAELRGARVDVRE